jgi:hypothetical protein
MFISIVSNAHNEKKIFTFPKGVSLLIVSSDSINNVDFVSCNNGLKEGVKPLQAYVITNVDVENKSVTMKQISCIKDIGTIYDLNAFQKYHTIKYNSKVIKKLNGYSQFAKGLSPNDDINKICDVFPYDKKLDNQRILFLHKINHRFLPSYNYINQVLENDSNHQNSKLYIVLKGTPGYSYSFDNTHKIQEPKGHRKECMPLSYTIHGCMGPVNIDRLKDDSLKVINDGELKIYYVGQNGQATITKIKQKEALCDSDNEITAKNLVSKVASLNSTEYALVDTEIYYIGNTLY